MWSAELYNCNAFVGGRGASTWACKVPASTLIYPKIFVNNLRLLNTGHPDAADTLVSDNVKEMSSPTRDGRAMINSGVHTDPPGRHADRRPQRGDPTPKVTIGPRFEYRRLVDRIFPHKDGRAVQASKFSVIAALAAGLALSGCATTAPQKYCGGIRQAPAAATGGVAQRDLTPQEKKAIVDAVAPSLRDPGIGKIQMGKVSRGRDRGFGQLLRHRRRQESLPRL